jgi:hypothetical protein
VVRLSAAEGRFFLAKGIPNALDHRPDWASTGDVDAERASTPAILVSVVVVQKRWVLVHLSSKIVEAVQPQMGLENTATSCQKHNHFY